MIRLSGWWLIVIPAPSSVHRSVMDNILCSDPELSSGIVERMILRVTDSTCFVQSGLRTVCSQRACCTQHTAHSRWVTMELYLRKWVLREWPTVWLPGLTYVSCKWGHEGRRTQHSNRCNRGFWKGCWQHLLSWPPDLCRHCMTIQAHSHRSTKWGCSSCLASRSSFSRCSRGSSQSRTSSRRPCTRAAVGLLLIRSWTNGQQVNVRTWSDG